jgi:four helix bundle protein
MDKPFDLEERTYLFAKQVRSFLKTLPRTVANQEDGRQLVRSSGSVGANYIEAIESLGKKDRLFRLRTARKEAKESALWLRLLDTGTTQSVEAERDNLLQEARELVKILSSIIRKSE